MKNENRVYPCLPLDRTQVDGQIYPIAFSGGYSCKGLQIFGYSTERALQNAIRRKLAQVRHISGVRTS